MRGEGATVVGSEGVSGHRIPVVVIDQRKDWIHEAPGRVQGEGCSFLKKDVVNERRLDFRGAFE